MPETHLDHNAVDRIINADKIEDAWVVLLEKASSSGFDAVVFGLNRLRRTGNFGEGHDSFFLSDLPAPVMQRLVEEQHYRNLPVAVWAMQNKGVISLQYGSDLYHAGLLSPEMAETQKMFMDAGVTGGYVVSFAEPGSAEASAVTFLALGRAQEEVDKIWQRCGPFLRTYAALFNQRVARLPLPLPGRRLTERQKEVLHWTAQGKTSSEIATILGLSIATIEKHLRQAREVFGASTTLQAVLYAQITSQIFTNRR